MATLPHALFRAEQVRELDRVAIQEQGIAGYTLMERAGKACFQALERQWPKARRLVVLCGAGNNGGDGYMLARLAKEAGFPAKVLALADPESLKGDARAAFRAWRNAGGETLGFDEAHLERADVIVDALLGTGLQRGVSGEWRRAVEAINEASVPKLAVDIPSGLHADTGIALGAAVRADVTVSFIGLKQGLFTGQGPAHSGAVVFDNLDIPDEVYLHVPPSASRISRDVVSHLLGPRSPIAHKGHFGHVLVIGGDHGMSGAARMAGEAAARVGTGLVSVATRAAHAPLLSVACPELMCHGVEDPQAMEPLLRKATVVAVGPGLGRGEWARALMARVLETQLPLVVDADGLNLLAEEPFARGEWVLTPHPGEAARLLGATVDEVQADRFSAVEALVGGYRGVCVLKGAGTLVRAEDGAVYLCDAGNPGMASGGMGDVLTGVIAGLVAQGLDLEDAARSGVYVHSAAGDAAAAEGQRGILATDLMRHLRRLVNPSLE